MGFLLRVKTDSGKQITKYSFVDGINHFVVNE